MTKQQMRDQIESDLRKQPGAAWDPAVIDATLDAGIPEGTTIQSEARGGQQTEAKYGGGKINLYVGGILKQSLDAAAGSAVYEKALMAYASRKSW